MSRFVRTNVALGLSTLGLVGVRGSARGGVIGVLTDLERSSYFPAGGGAVRGPGRRLYHTPNRLSMYGGGLGVIMFGIVGRAGESCGDSRAIGTCGARDSISAFELRICLVVEFSEMLR